MPYADKPLKRVNGLIVPQYWNSTTEDWEILEGEGGAYRMQSSVDISEEPFSASGNLTKEFTAEMSGIVISNDGNADLTFAIHGKTRTVKAGEVYSGKFKPFTTVTVTSSVPWRAEALQAYGLSPAVEVPSDTTAPDNVASVTAASITQTGLTLNWVASASMDTVGYDVYRGSTLLGSVTGTTYNVTGLSAGTQYTFTVRTKDAANNISSGTSGTFTTAAADPEDTTPPNNVTGLAASNVTHNSLTLTWSVSSSSDVASYDVYQGSTLLGNVSGTTYNVTGLSAETAYTFSVRARDGSGNVASGTSVQATTSAAPVGDTTAPTVTASPAAGTYSATQSVTLSSNETATIYYTLDGSTPTESSSVYGSAISITATTTLKFFGKDTAGNSSSVQTAVYTIQSSGGPTGHVTDGLVNKWDNITAQTSFANDGAYFPSTGNFTVAATLKPKAFLNILSQFNVGSPAVSTVRFYVDSTGQKVSLTAFGVKADTTAQTLTGTSATSDLAVSTSYYHVVLVKETSSFKVYVNDSMKLTVSIPAGWTLNSNLSSENVKRGDASCDILHLLYYNRLLTTEELTQNYNNLMG